ncbi:acetyltransferase [Colletotrichum karsti]|uniref:Acetyltransferase n=1 Tax=Colletotrichum karsti TaxID=1095194 RepID=A0A9P6I9W4_9PEZI|nr:acetyltransferase [Colletotrichum karsti]KAF9878914.1 acetyltransferase [Colletotrichum karsti]
MAPDGTPFVSLLEPPSLDTFIRGKPHNEQPDSVPQLFRDAMEVREKVFVKEQGVPLENEVDADDNRSFHWVTYASINKKIQDEVLDADGNILEPQRSSTRSTPIGTIRVVPFPHDPHPRNGGVYWDGKLVEEKVDGDVVKSAEEQKSPVKADGVAGAAEHVGDERRSSMPKPYAGPDRATDMHDGIEPYVKLGRLAVDKELRGHRVANLLVTTALAWLKSNPRRFDPSIKEMGIDGIGASTLDELPKWKGLVCVHAQAQVVRLWEKMGFKVDEAMGTWTEEGIEHKGMFKRLEVDREPSVVPSTLPSTLI